MTVPAQATLFNSSVANGVTTSFPYTFMILSEADIIVMTDGVIQTSGFSLTGVGSQVGGSVVFDVAPSNGVVVNRYLDVALERANDYQQFGDWLASVINADLDRIVLGMQSLYRQGERAIKLPANTSGDQTLSGTSAERAGKVIGFDAFGDLVLMAGTAGTSLVSLAAANGSSLVGFIQTGTGATTRTAQAKQRDVVSAKDFGAVGNGTTDDSSAIQAALTALGTAGGGTLYCPAGNYLIGAFLSIPADVMVLGDGMGATIFTHKSGLTGVGNLFQSAGDRAGFQDFTIIGNTAGNAGFAYAELTDTGYSDVRITNVEILDWMNQAIAAYGVGTLIQGCRIIGNGATSVNGSGVAVNSVYCIWSATTGARVRIIGNTLKDTAYGAIFCGGRTIIEGNYITGTHWSYSPGGGGAIADGAAGCVIASNNYIGPPGTGGAGSGFELNNESVIVGNEIENQGFYGIILQASTGSGHTVTGNLIKRAGAGWGGAATQYGIVALANVNDFTISGNTISDDSGTPTMDYGIAVIAGTSNRYAITGNRVYGATTADISDLGTGAVKEVQGNVCTLAKGVVSTDGTTLNANAAGGTVGAGATNFIGFGAGASFIATENLREQIMSRAGRISRLSVKTIGATGGGGNMVVTLRVNGADTGVTVTFAAGAGAGTQVDSVNTALIAAGDLVDLKFVNNNGGAVSAAVGAFSCLFS